MMSATSADRPDRANGTGPGAVLRRFFISVRERQDRGAIIVLMALLVARLAFAALVYARPSLAVANDTDRYVPIANAILSGKAYTWNTERPGELLNTIGYPLYLAAVFLVFGRNPGDVALAQLILSGTIVMIFYLVLARAVGTKAALISAILLALDPLTILWSMTILTETLFACLLGISALMLIRWSSSGSIVTLLLAGLFGGFAWLVKPYAELIVAVWATGILFLPHPGVATGVRRTVSALRSALLFILPSVLLVAPWYVRNGLLWNCPTLSSVDRVTMRDYVAAKIVSEAEHIPLEQAQGQLQAQDPGPCPRNNAAYVNLVLTHPETYATLHLAGTIPVLFGTSFDRWLQFFGIDYSLPDLFQPFMDAGVGGVARVLGQEFLRFPPGLGLMLCLIAFQLLVYLLSIAGVLSLRSAPSTAQRWNILMLIIAVLILVLTPGQGGHERFRVPAQPLLMILVGYGLAWTILPALRGRRMPVQAHRDTAP